MIALSTTSMTAIETVSDGERERNGRRQRDSGAKQRQHRQE